MRDPGQFGRQADRRAEHRLGGVGEVDDIQDVPGLGDPPRSRKTGPDRAAGDVATLGLLAGDGLAMGDIQAAFRSEGGTGPGYTSIVAAGDNACVLHYVTNSDVIEDGELVLVDAGGEVAHYTADVTRTWPANGTFTEAQRAVYDAVLEAQLAAIAMCKPGSTFDEVHQTAVHALTRSMVTLGLLQGEVDALIRDEKYKRYYMHGTGHWLGLDVHDVGVYGRHGQSRVLAPGMVLTVEPGLYIQPDDTEAPEHLRGIGVRIEDDVLITATGHEVLTASAPKLPDELERICARG